MSLQTRKTSFITFTCLLSVLSLLLVAGAYPVQATSGSREAQGVVIDSEGNPVQGAVVTFTPADAANKQPVTAKTNKKGRFFVNLFSDKGDNFEIAIEAEGYLPVDVFLESRTVNKVLLGDPISKTLKYGQNIPQIYIRPLGTGEVKITLGAEADVLGAAQAEAAVVASEQAAKKETVQPQKDPWAEALALAADGDLEEAIPFFEKAVEKKPDDLERREAFAKVLYQSDRHQDAVVQASKAVELAPQSVGPRMVIYSAQVALGDLDAAKVVLEEARTIAPTNVNVLEQLGYVADQQGDTQAAIRTYEQVVELSADEADIWARLGDLYAGVGDSAKSEAAYVRVSELDPEGAHQVFFNIGALIMNRSTRSEQDTQKAIDAFRQAIQVKPDYAEAHKQLAFALLGAGDRSGAKTELQAYVQHAPDAPDATQMKSLAEAM
jgi:tetratricopeptide (TPR) repeat protein